ncbi:hypothetical protein A4R26_11765 [Niastella populi]|uniref:Uncharacterized protein n=1 Tax=Niastella populi TaxID=550983 RepID=A0A1V9GB85_9BACT|nr:hypothetical protein A4R26_11765 [Niastella populi]
MESTARRGKSGFRVPVTGFRGFCPGLAFIGLQVGGYRLHSWARFYWVAGYRFSFQASGLRFRIARPVNNFTTRISTPCIPEPGTHPRSGKFTDNAAHPETGNYLPLFRFICTLFHGTMRYPYIRTCN